MFLTVTLLALLGAAPLPRGGGLDDRPRIVQTSHFDGTTAVGVLPAVHFQGRNAEGALTQVLADRLAGAARFLGDAGDVVPAVATLGSSELGGWTFSVQLAPQRPLKLDRWYTLEVLREVAVVIGSVEESEGTTEDTLRSRLYTGSAPSVRRLIVADDSAKPMRTIDVLFSEPVDLGTVSDGFAAELDGTSLAGCVAWEGQCVRGGTRTARSNAASFLLSRPLAGRALLLGQTRLRALGREVVLPSNGWKACAGDPASRCVKLAR